MSDIEEKFIIIAFGALVLISIFWMGAIFGETKVYDSARDNGYGRYDTHRNFIWRKDEK